MKSMVTSVVPLVAVALEVLVDGVVPPHPASSAAVPIPEYVRNSRRFMIADLSLVNRWGGG